MSTKTYSVVKVEGINLIITEFNKIGPAIALAKEVINGNPTYLLENINIFTTNNITYVNGQNIVFMSKRLQNKYYNSDEHVALVKKPLKLILTNGKTIPINKYDNYKLNKNADTYAFNTDVVSIFLHTKKVDKKSFSTAYTNILVINENSNNK